MPGRLSLSPSIAAPARRVAASSNGAQRTHALCVPHASGQVLTVEATGLLPAMFVGKALQLPVVFARKSRQMGVADSYQTSYKPSTKSSIQDIFVSTEVPSTRGAPAKPQPPSTTPPPPMAPLDAQPRSSLWWCLLSSTSTPATVVSSSMTSSRVAPLRMRSFDCVAWRERASSAAAS